MVHALRGWGNGRIVPRGPLREEPRALLSRADVVALHHFPRFVSNETETDERKARKSAPPRRWNATCARFWIPTGTLW